MIYAFSEDSDQPEHLPSLITESLLCALLVVKEPNLAVDTEDSDQIGQILRLIWVFAEYILSC